MPLEHMRVSRDVLGAMIGAQPDRRGAGTVRLATEWDARIEKRRGHRVLIVRPARNSVHEAVLSKAALKGPLALNMYPAPITV